jgi:hypothetical protein
MLALLVQVVVDGGSCAGPRSHPIPSGLPSSAADANKWELWPRRDHQ